jgi:hypothetical protein
MEHALAYSRRATAVLGIALATLSLTVASAQAPATLPAELWVACDDRPGDAGPHIARFDSMGTPLAPSILPDEFPFWDHTVGPDGNAYVLVTTFGGVVRWNPKTGTRVPVSRYNPVTETTITDDFVSWDPSLNGGLNYGVGMAFGPDGNLYVCAGGPGEFGAGQCAVYRFNGTTGDFMDFPVPAGTPNLTTGGDIVLGPDGRLYIGSGVQHGGVSANAVLQYDPATGITKTFVHPENNGGLVRPSQMAFGPDGHLYIVSAGTNGVKRYHGATGAPLGDVVPGGEPTEEIDPLFGTPIYTAGDGGHLITPLGLAFGADGSLYVSCYNNDANHVWDASTPGAVIRYRPDTGERLNEFITHDSGHIYGAGFLYFNGGVTTPSEAPVVVQPTATTTLTFSQVTGGGQTTVIPLSDPEDLALTIPADFSVASDPENPSNGVATFYEVSTTATFTGSITLSFKYDEAKYGDESRVRLLHGVVTGTDPVSGRPIYRWDDITTSVDTENNIVYGQTSSLSPFAVLEQRAPQYGINLLFDNTRPVRSGATLPIKLQLIRGGVNVSAPGLPVTARGIDRVSATVDGALQSPGSANPDSNFRYAADLQGYIFNLSTRGYGTGKYRIRLDVAGDPVPYSLVFEVK